MKYTVLSDFAQGFILDATEVKKFKITAAEDKLLCAF
jgi:hypothetical protein